MSDISLNEFATPASLDESLDMSRSGSISLPFEFATNIPIDPTVTVISPGGSGIGTQAPWVGRVTLATPDGTVRRIIIAVSYLTGTYEVAYINDAFTPAYSGLSTLVQSSPGVFDISLIHNGGWPSSPRIFVHANTDRGGMTQ